jgi:GT2 family glycosyltransferase
MKISFIIPVFNNFEYTKHIYLNLKEYYPDDEIVLSDGGSTDQTIEYFSKLEDPNLIFVDNGLIDLCKNYNSGVKHATQEIVILLHNDMFIPPDFKEKILVDLDENSMVSFSRIEPPVFPGEEPGKIVRDFGFDLNTLNKEAIISFCSNYSDKYEGGGLLFTACYKKNYLGLDDITYNPPQMWCSDDDLHNRYILSGLKRIISNACVYHFVSKTSRKENYQEVEYHSSRNFIRKWGSRNFIIKYDIGYIIKNCNPQLISTLELFASTIYVDCPYQDYIKLEQPNTKFDLNKRIKNINDPKTNQILIEFDATQLNQNNFQLLQQFPQIISESGGIGTFELDIFKLDISGMDRLEKYLLEILSPYHQSQLLKN